MAYGEPGKHRLWFVSVNHLTEYGTLATLLERVPQITQQFRILTVLLPHGKAPDRFPLACADVLGCRRV
jgi:hypothetical protein